MDGSTTNSISRLSSSAIGYENHPYQAHMLLNHNAADHYGVLSYLYTCTVLAILYCHICRIFFCPFIVKHKTTSSQLQENDQIFILSNTQSPNSCTIPNPTMSDSVEATGRRYRIGFAMEPKKVKSILQNSLIDLASKRGIDLVEIDLNKPLMEQQQSTPFDAIIHKLYSEEWRIQLIELGAEHPSVVVIDPLEHIQKLHHRITMLEVVNNIPGRAESVGIPKQIVVETETKTGLSQEDLKFPVIAKPLVANGSIGSHQMFLLFNEDGLNELKPPFVLQEFINHGGVIFKIYVAGEQVRCVKRKSLPDISDSKLRSTPQNLVPFSQISNVTAQDYSEVSFEKLIEEAEMPSKSFFTELAQELRKGLKLNLFNFDMIRDSNDPNRYLVIDINYFPGYSKIPSYETMLIDFFLSVLQCK